MTEMQLPSSQVPPVVGQSDLERIVRKLNNQTSDALRRTIFVDLSFGGGWSNLGSGNRECGAARIANEIVLRGMAVSSGTGVLSVVSTLGVGWRPTDSEWFAAATTTGQTSVGINAAGQIVVRDAIAAGDWVSLSGVRFYTD